MVKRYESKLATLQVQLDALIAERSQRSTEWPKPGLQAVHMNLQSMTPIPSTDCHDKVVNGNLVGAVRPNIEKTSLKTVPKATPISADDLTIICTNLPESEAFSLRDRQKDDLEKWHHLCETIGVKADVSSITRLHRQPKSPHEDSPRLVRIVLRTAKEVEDVLLAAHLLHKSDSKARIFPDIPWSEREMRRKNPEAARRYGDRKAIIIHGVPEPKTEDKTLARQHDCGEWRYIQELLGLQGILTTSINRMNPPEKLALKSPRLLKITVRTPEMAQLVLETWYSKRSMAPPEIRMRVPYECKAKDPNIIAQTYNVEEDLSTHEATATTEVLDVLQSAFQPTALANATAVITSASKNASKPTTSRSAQRATH